MSELSKGATHELEHDITPAKAKEVAQDHLAEDPKYYSHLSLMEKSVKAVQQKQPAKLPSYTQWKQASEVAVVTTAMGTWLKIGHQIQGGSATEPSASVVDAGLTGPGPVSLCDYQAGWLLAGAAHPSAKAVMAGLGAGSGAVALLYNFPDISLDIGEISSDVIEAAFEAFPLLGYYVSEGRLNVHHCDVAELLDNHYELGFADAYIGHNTHVDSYLHKMAAAVEAMYVNVIGGEDTPAVVEVAAMLNAIPMRVHPGIQTNWIVTSDTAEPDHDFLPYPELDGQVVATQRHAYDNLYTQRY